MPIITPSGFKKKIGRRAVMDYIASEAFHLSYTGVDLKPFAADQGHKRAPFAWDDDDRRHRMARLDALFFQLYGLDRDDAAYVLDQFPIVRREDESVFGRYLTRDLILAYMNAVAAGDLDTVIDLNTI